jgi:hypothetical protein
MTEQADLYSMTASTQQDPASKYSARYELQGLNRQMLLKLDDMQACA